MLGEQCLGEGVGGRGGVVGRRGWGKMTRDADECQWEMSASGQTGRMTEAEGPGRGCGKGAVVGRRGWVEEGRVGEGELVVTQRLEAARQQEVGHNSRQVAKPGPAGRADSRQGAGSPVTLVQSGHHVSQHRGVLAPAGRNCYLHRSSIRVGRGSDGCPGRGQSGPTFSPGLNSLLSTMVLWTSSSRAA